MTGGYRNEGKTSQLIPNKPVISIITIVYNSENLVERTIQSVLEQTYPNIEYILIDGNSKDKTIEIIKHYEDRIAFWISEPDKGIYDAMNKGLHQASGDYVLFLNSGDALHHAETLERIFALPTADIYYGETEMFNQAWESLGDRRLKAPKVLTWKSFRMGMLVCHQSIIIKKSITTPYDLQYKISADVDWVIKCLKKASSITNTKGYIAKYLVGGFSRQNTIRSLKERFKIMVTHYGLPTVVWCHVLIFFRFWGYYIRNWKLN